jgi:hypothetical protein
MFKAPQLQIASINVVSIASAIFMPPVISSIILVTAYSIERGVSGGAPLSLATKKLNCFAFFFGLGTNYFIAMIGIFKLPGWSLWIFIPIWAALMVWFTYWWYRRKETGSLFSTAQN